MTGRIFAPRVQILVALALVTGCRSNGGSSADRERPPVAAEAEPVSVFAYEPTLRKVVPPDIPVAVVMEAELPDAGELYILAAVAREQPSLELHRFETVEGILQPTGAQPVRPVRLAAGDTALEELSSLRRQFNAPGSTRRRPIGLDVETPGEVIAELERARGEYEAGSHLGLATMLRGLSDAIVFEQDAIPEAMAAVEALGEFETIMHGTRRAELVGADATLELHKQSGGWVVFATKP